MFLLFVALTGAQTSSSGTYNNWLSGGDQAWITAAVDSRPTSRQVATACGPTAAGWQSSRKNRTAPANTVIIQGRTATWNGTPIEAGRVRQYLTITSQMAPQPVFVLMKRPNADCQEVNSFRRMANEILKCDGGRCVEVDLR